MLVNSPEKGNPDTYTSRDYVYTEWDVIKHFVDDFLETLAPEVARDPRSQSGSRTGPALPRSAVD
jgi:hypothetical protein